MTVIKAGNFKLKIAALCLAAALLSMTGCSDLIRHTVGGPDKKISDSDSGGDSVPENYQSPYDGAQGSAGSLSGRTLIVSLFTDDAGTSWDWDLSEDNEMIYDTLDNLRISTDYLSEQAANFGASAEFIYDWEMNPDICFKAEFDESLVTEFGDMYDVQKNWIDNNVDTQALRNKYLADNVIYLFFFNTDFSNQVNPWYLGYSCSPDYYVEFCNIYVRFDDIYVTKPTSYAHEMMHCFGAHDLYYANEFIPQKYVDHLGKICSNDIMYTVYDSKDISNEFTELDAYYVGILDECDEVGKWGLALSEHFSDN